MKTIGTKTENHQNEGKLGTFSGVFTPSILTILGIILFLRLGYVVGSAGLGRALIIITLANAISVLTSISLSAVATNIKVKGGGDYYLISRTLGPEFGGAIGMVLFLACLLVMLAIDFKVGLIAVAILFAIYQYLKRTSGPARWADSRRFYYLQRARENLLEAYVEPEHDRDWRPQILAFSKDAQRRPGLLRFASWIEGRSGLTTVVKILEGEGVKMLKHQEESESELRSDIAAHGFAAFPLVVFAPDLDIALNTLIQSTGVGPLKANTILLNWLDPESEITNDQREISFVRNLRAAYRLGRNIVVLDADEDKWNTLENIPGEDRRIDVWWLNDATSRLMLLLGYLITRSEPWDAAKIRVLAAGYNADTPENLTDLKNNLEEARIEAEPIIVTNADIDKLSEYSADAAVVFLPFRLRGDQITCPIDAPIEEIVCRLPVTALVLAAEDIALDAEPEEGTAGDMAVAMDALADAEKKAVEAEKDAAKTREIAESARAKLLELENNTRDTEEDLRTKLKTAADNAEKEADKAFCKAAKARGKVEEAAKIVKELDPTVESKEKREQ